MTRPEPISAMRTRAYRAAIWAYARVRRGGPPKEGLRVLMYHSIGTPVEGDTRGQYNISYALFERHMRYLAEYYAQDLIPIDSHATAEGRLRIAVTLDDGYRNNLQVAAPLLVELGIPFTVFVCTGAVVGRQADFLQPEDVRQLARLRGATIGSHSVSHSHLSRADDRKLYKELRDSKAYLEELLGAGIDLLSYPHGAVDRRVRDAAENVGYRIGATSRFDINRPGQDPLLLCRTDIWADDDIRVFQQKLRGDWDWYRWRTADPGRRAK